MTEFDERAVCPFKETPSHVQLRNDTLYYWVASWLDPSAVVCGYNGNIFESRTVTTYDNITGCVIFMIRLSDNAPVQVDSRRPYLLVVSTHDAHADAQLQFMCMEVASDEAFVLSHATRTGFIDVATIIEKIQLLNCRAIDAEGFGLYVDYVWGEDPRWIKLNVLVIIRNLMERAAALGYELHRGTEDGFILNPRINALSPRDLFLSYLGRFPEIIGSLEVPFRSSAVLKAVQRKRYVPANVEIAHSVGCTETEVSRHFRRINWAILANLALRGGGDRNSLLDVEYRNDKGELISSRVSCSSKYHHHLIVVSKQILLGTQPASILASLKEEQRRFYDFITTPDHNYCYPSSATILREFGELSGRSGVNQRLTYIVSKLAERTVHDLAIRISIVLVDGTSSDFLQRHIRALRVIQHEISLGTPFGAREGYVNYKKMRELTGVAVYLWREIVRELGEIDLAV